MSTQSSARNSAVKATIKVYSEMQEDQSCKLAMRFTQLKIVLATHKIVSSFHKLKSLRLQHYFDVLNFNKQTIQNNLPQKPQIQYLTPPTKKKSVKFQSRLGIPQFLLLETIFNKHKFKYFIVLIKNKQNRRQKYFEFTKTLTNLIDTQKQLTFNKFKSQSQLYIAIRKLNFIISQKQNQLQLKSFIHIAKQIHIHAINSQQISVLDSLVSQGFENQMMSAKEQLAMKFASTSLLIGILSQVMIKAQFAFLLHLRQSNFQKVDVREIKSIDISENLEQSIIEEDRIKPKIIAANQIMNMMTSKLREYFETLRNPSTMKSSNLLDSEIVTRKSKPNIKLFLLGQKVFKEDENQQKSTDITMNEKKHQITLPGVRYVTQYSDLSKNLLSDSDVTVKSSDHVIQNNQTQTSIIMHRQLKKEKLNSAIQKYRNSIYNIVSPSQINNNNHNNNNNNEQKTKSKSTVPVKKKFSKFYLLLPLILIILLALFKN